MFYLFQPPKSRLKSPSVLYGWTPLPENSSHSFYLFMGAFQPLRCTLHEFWSAMCVGVPKKRRCAVLRKKVDHGWWKRSSWDFLDERVEVVKMSCDWFLCPLGQPWVFSNQLIDPNQHEYSPNLAGQISLPTSSNPGEFPKNGGGLVRGIHPHPEKTRNFSVSGNSLENFAQMLG